MTVDELLQQRANETRALILGQPPRSSRKVLPGWEAKPKIDLYACSVRELEWMLPTTKLTAVLAAATSYVIVGEVGVKAQFVPSELAVTFRAHYYVARSAQPQDALDVYVVYGDATAQFVPEIISTKVMVE